MNKYIGLVVFCTLITGCATNPSFYNAKNLPQSQLATVVSEESKWYDSKITPMISNVYNEKMVEVIGSSTWGTAFHTKVSLEPGKYLFVIRCGNGSVYAYLRAIAKLEPSKRYVMNCISTTKKGFLGIPTYDKARVEINEFGA